MPLVTLMVLAGPRSCRQARASVGTDRELAAGRVVENADLSRKSARNMYRKT
jgi:hypothetical protein